MVFNGLLLINSRGHAQIPKVGDSLKMEIANWNLEWFGKTGYGPSDEKLQQSNVLKVIRAADIDIWSFCEVSNPAVFDTFMSQLPEYQYTLCNYIPEQKTAVIFKKNMFSLVGSQLIGTGNPDSFSTLRFPFLVQLKPLQSTGVDTINLIVLHLKANVGTSSEKLDAYNSRKRSGEWLKMYLDKYQSKNYCMVLGDWNDDIDESIYNGLPSPFSGLANNEPGFEFITRKFTDSHQGTTTGYTDAIDHQLISARLKPYLWYNSTTIFNLSPYISSYSSTTSDHYPVYSLFSVNSANDHQMTDDDGTLIYPQPADQYFYLSSKDMEAGNTAIRLFDLQGRLVAEHHLNRGDRIATASLPEGCYQVIINSPSATVCKKLMIRHQN